MKIWNDCNWVPTPPKGLTGFVYEITEKDTGMKYIGIKRFWKTVTKPPLKGRKNKRHKIVESDWRTYTSSNKELSAKIEKNPENYERIILRLCTSISDMKAHEAWYQLNYYVSGRWNELMNEVINLRLRIRHKE